MALAIVDPLQRRELSPEMRASYRYSGPSATLDAELDALSLGATPSPAHLGSTHCLPEALSTVQPQVNAHLSHLLGGRTWNGGTVLASYLNNNASWAARLRGGIHVLELGAGTGVIGLAAATIAAGAGSTTLTDKDAGIVDALRTSLRSHGFGRACRAMTYTWGEGEAAPLLPLSAIGGFDLILGGECLYSVGTSGAFCDALDALEPASASATILITIEERWSTQECLDVLLERGWHTEVLETATTPPMPSEREPATVRLMAVSRVAGSLRGG